MAAIARDASSTFAWSSGTTASGNHTCTGSELLLIVGVITTGITSETVTGITYNGVAMTRSRTDLLSGSRLMTLFHLANPATGSNSVQVTWSAGTFGSANILVASYTGCRQTSIPDAHGETDQGSGTSNTVSITTVSNNCWLAGIAESDGAALTAGTGASELISAGSDTRNFYDSNGAKTPAGAHSMQVTWTGSQANRFCAIAFAPSQPTITVTETITHTDSFVKTPGKNFTETITHTDSFLRSITKIFTETVTFTDVLNSLSRVISFAVTEALSLIDTVTVASMWTKRTKPTTNWTDRTPPTTNWTDV